jgi:RimJ/RimL family protein N-acetyltransferase
LPQPCRSRSIRRLPADPVDRPTRPKLDGLEIGYWIHQDHVGRGLATRLSRCLTTGAFSLDQITHVEIHCDQANAASRRVPERLGFDYVGDVVRPIEAPAETGTHRVCRMHRADWDG